MLDSLISNKRAILTQDMNRGNCFKNFFCNSKSFFFLNVEVVIGGNKSSDYILPGQTPPQNVSPPFLSQTLLIHLPQIYIQGNAPHKALLNSV